MASDDAPHGAKVGGRSSAFAQRRHAIIRHLPYFVVVAEELNLRRAADRLEITQPALTKQVSGLEEQMGVSLFARERHRLAGLTSAGTDFLVEARHILDQVEDAIRGVQLVAHGRSGRRWCCS